MTDWVQEASDWLVDETLRGTRADRLVRGLCEKMAEGGVPLVRVQIACGLLHPLFKAFSICWNRDEGLVRDRFAYSSPTSEAWLVSPLKAVLQPGEESEIRARLKLGEGINQFPVLKEFKDRGYTDYYCTRKAFTWPEENAFASMDGCIASFATDAPEGFTERCIATIRRLFPRLAVAMKTLVREGTAQNLASTYLGSQAGERVLNGRIRRGEYDKIQAVVWYSDMRQSTELADRMPPELFIERLNRYFECTAGAVLDHGGEVLRFIGDAVLAIFPINGPGGAERASRMAVAAARDAFRHVERINENLPEDDPVPIRFGLGLHVGDVMFGNIGVPERLEFSVIGACANETARLEDLTKTLDRPVLASDAFSNLVDNADWDPMGSHRLRGVSEPQPIYALVL